jgi:YjjG family noncanonical pyrimidine nucleotidase
MIKVVMLDIDDTLLSFERYVVEAMRNGFGKFGIAEYTDDMHGVFNKINTELWRRIERGEITLEELKRDRWNMIFKRLGIDFDGERFEKYFREGLFESAIPEEGALDLLEYLNGKYILCAASNGPYLQQKNRLRIGKMLGYFFEVFVSEDIGSSKPYESFFATCVERLELKMGENIKADEIIIIGDSLSSDMKGGIRFGMKTCFYNPDKKDLPDGMSVDHQVTSLSEIKNIL